MSKHPFRAILERFGLVRTEGQQVERYRAADEVVEVGKRAAAEARRRRLSAETRSYRNYDHE